MTLQLAAGGMARRDRGRPCGPEYLGTYHGPADPGQASAPVLVMAASYTCNQLTTFRSLDRAAPTRTPEHQEIQREALNNMRSLPRHDPGHSVASMSQPRLTLWYIFIDFQRLKDKLN